jgi:hypothetical protein
MEGWESEFLGSHQVLSVYSQTVAATDTKDTNSFMMTT